ncbi:MAG: ABC transporter substrate-binding protein [Hyphomicrobiaceae bacterium]
MPGQRLTRLKPLLLAIGTCLLMTAATDGPAIAAQPDHLVIAAPSQIDTLDPHINLDTRSAGVRLQLYDGLFRWQGSPLRIAPWLAQSYTVSEDGRTFRFSLRLGAKFHDGRDVRAADVVYSIERVLALKRGMAPLLAGLVAPGSTKAIDNHTVEFVLNRASPLFLALLPELAIVNAELLKANEINNDWGRGWLQDNDAGSGSYAFKQRTPMGSVVAGRYAQHWNSNWSERPVEEVEWRPMIDPEARIAAFTRGDVQVLQGTYLPGELKRLRQTKDASVLMSESPRAFVGILNSGREPMKTPGFRKILAQAFNTDWFIRSTLGETATPLGIPIPPTLGSQPSGFTRPSFDIPAARDALAKLKLQPPYEFAIGAIAGDPHSERAALIMLEGMLSLGLVAHIVSEPWPVVANRMRNEKQMYDILFLWRGARYLDANNWVGEMFDCDLFGAGNASWYCNRDADRLIKEARGATDQKLRRQGFEKAAVLVAQDHAGLFIATAKRPIAYSKSVKGLQISPVGEAIEVRSVTIDRAAGGQ